MQISNVASKGGETIFMTLMRGAGLMIRPLFILTIVAPLLFQDAYAQMHSGRESYLGKETTLCKANEDVYFSCPLKGTSKTVSVCAAQNTSSSNGYVQYRYGTPEKIDLKYPDSLSAPKGNLVLTDATQGSVKGYHLKFHNSGFDYVVSSIFPGRLYVEKDKKIVLDKECGKTAFNSFSYKAPSGIDGADMSDIDDHDTE